MADPTNPFAGYDWTNFQNSYQTAMQRAGINPLSGSPYANYVQQQMPTAQSQYQLNTINSPTGTFGEPNDISNFLNRFMQTGGRGASGVDYFGNPGGPRGQLSNLSYLSNMLAEPGKANPDPNVANQAAQYTANNPYGAGMLQQIQGSPYEVANLYTSAYGPNPFAAQLGRYYETLGRQRMAGAAPTSNMNYLNALSSFMT